jgi:LmbE family N-acetylglucosaminyl deacetylase
MTEINFNFQRAASPQVLCLGAHSDDIEIGCGGALLYLIARYPNLRFLWVVFSSNDKRASEAYNSAYQFLGPVREKQVIVKRFRDGFFPYLGADIKEFFEELKMTASPDLIFTHARHDLHQDHRLICELTWNTFRNHLILEYEIAKYDGDLGQPNLYIHLDEAICRAKVNALSTHFSTQTEKHWFSEETFLSLLRLRGIESRSPTGYAEAFYARKLIMGHSDV